MAKGYGVLLGVGGVAGATGQGDTTSASSTPSDLTGAMTFDITAQWSAASNSNSIKINAASAEVLTN